MRIHRIVIRKYRELMGNFFKSSQIRDFQEINMKPQISENRELRGIAVINETKPKIFTK